MATTPDDMEPDEEGKAYLKEGSKPLGDNDLQRQKAVRGRKKYHPEVIDAARGWYEAGADFQRIAALTGIPATTVSHLASKHSWARGGKAMVLREQEAIELSRAGGLSKGNATQETVNQDLMRLAGGIASGLQGLSFGRLMEQAVAVERLTNVVTRILNATQEGGKAGKKQPGAVFQHLSVSVAGMPETKAQVVDVE